MGVVVLLSLALHARLLAGGALFGTEWNPLVGDPTQWELPHLVAAAPGGAAWGPHAALGHPVGVLSHPTVHYPPAALLHALAPPWLAKTLHSLGHTLVLGLALLGWLRARGLGTRAATVGATLGLLSIAHTQWLAYPHRVASLAWVALGLWAADSSARRGSARQAILAGAALGVGLLTSIVQVAYYAVGFAAALAGPRSRADARRGLGRLSLLGLALATTFVAGAVPLAFEVLDGHRPAGHGGALVTWRHALLLFVPDAYGSPLRGAGLLDQLEGASPSPYLNYQELSLYVGLTTLALAAAGARAAPGVLGLVAVGLGLTCSSTLAAALGALPGLGASASLRALPTVHLLVAVLAGHGAQAWLRREPRARRSTAAVGALAVLAAVCLGTPPLSRAYLGLFGPQGAAARYAATDLRLDAAVPPAAWGRLHAAGGRTAFFPPATIAPLALGVALLLVSTRRWAPRSALAALLALGAFDLLHAGLSYNAVSDRSVAGPADRPDIDAVRGVVGDARAAWLRPPAFDANRLVLHEVRAVEAYHCMLPARTARLYAELGPATPFAQLLRPGPLPPAWRDALSVRALVAPRLGAESTHAALAEETIVRAGPDWVVWENADALPRARLHPPEAAVEVGGIEAAVEVLRRPGFDPRRHVVLEVLGPQRREARQLPDPPAPVPAAILVDEAERLVVEIPRGAADAGGVLLVADAWGRGWSARDGAGRPLELRPAQVALRGVPLPPGFVGPVELRYRRPGRWEGAALALAFGLTLALAARATIAPRRRRRGAT